MKTLTVENLSENAFEAVAKTIASKSFNGMFIALYGELGAGKTTFVRTFAGSLGVSDIISPTFTIVCEHTGSNGGLLLHFDAYKLCDVDELYAIGFEDYLDRNGIILMEWANKVSSILPPARLDVNIDGCGTEPRRVTITAYGRYYEHLLEAL